MLGQSNSYFDNLLRVSQYSVYPANWKPDTNYRPAMKPAKEYPFTLDPFQKQAIQYIERNESVLVSAHTSAGKVGDAGIYFLKQFLGYRAQVYCLEPEHVVRTSFLYSTENANVLHLLGNLVVVFLLCWIDSMLISLDTQACFQ